jgi:hypothetical protein
MSATDVGGGVLANSVRVCDATAANFLPTMDAVGRAGFQKITDGTNTMPTLDAVGRAGFVKLTDGTNTAPSMDAAGRAGFQKITDGTNTMPTMDAAGRKGFTAVTDGTNTAAVKAASTPAALTDPALVVAISPNCGLSKPTAGSPIRVSAKTSIKGSASVLFGLTMINTTSSTRWFQFFDAATTGAVTLGSTLPDLEFQVAANSTLTPPLPSDGIPFGNGIIMAVTTAEAGGTPGSAGDGLTFPVFV